MKSLRQREIEKDLKEGRYLKKQDKDDYVEAVFMVVKGKKSVDKEDQKDQTAELADKYSFKIKKADLGMVVDQIRSMPGVTIQTKSDIGGPEGKPSPQYHATPKSPANTIRY